MLGFVLDPLVLLLLFDLFMSVLLEPGWLDVSLVEPLVGGVALPLVEPLTPVDPALPLVPTEPLEPVEPVEPLTPVEPLEPVEPAEPLTPVEPLAPVDPVVPLVPSEPDEPLVPVESLVPVEPVALPLVPWEVESRFRSRGELVSLDSERFWVVLRPWRSRWVFAFA